MPDQLATPTEGFFTGTASGDLPGTFDTRVIHTPLSTSATITGDSFTLDAVNGSAATVEGAFSAGTVTQIERNRHGCRDHYAVIGTLTNVGIGVSPR